MAKFHVIIRIGQIAHISGIAAAADEHALPVVGRWQAPGATFHFMVCIFSKSKLVIELRQHQLNILKQFRGQKFFITVESII